MKEVFASPAYLYSGEHTVVLDEYHHHYPDWMPLSMHYAIERKIIYRFLRFDPTHPLGAIYHFVHGLVCGHTLTEVIRFIIRYYRVVRPEILEGMRRRYKDYKVPVLKPIDDVRTIRVIAVKKNNNVHVLPTCDMIKVMTMFGVTIDYD